MGELAAISAASARAALCTPSTSAATSFTSPISLARSALMSLPVYASSARCPALMMAGRRCRLPRSATMATLASRTEKTASDDASRMSQAAMRSTPPPMQ